MKSGVVKNSVCVTKLLFPEEVLNIDETLTVLNILYSKTFIRIIVYNRFFKLVLIRSLNFELKIRINMAIYNTIYYKSVLQNNGNYLFRTY